MTIRSGGDDALVSQAQNLVDANFFQQFLYFETQKALRLRYAISLLCVAVSETRQGGNAASTRHVADTMVRRLRATDVATVWSASAVSILLVDAEIQSVRPIFDRATETLRGHPVAFGARESPPSLRAGAVCFPRTSTNASDLMRQAIALMTRADQEGIAFLSLPD